MNNIDDIWAETMPPHEHGGAVTMEEWKLIASLDWYPGANWLAVVWDHNSHGLPQAYLWPMRLGEDEGVPPRWLN